MWNTVTECCLRIANHFTRRKSVLMIGMEAASTRDPTALQRSMKPDPTLNLPYQVPRLDGEERHPPKKYHMGPEHDETTREFIRAPANKTVTDVGNEATHRPTHLAMYSTPGECGPYSHLHHPPSSSSSSSSQPGYGDEGRSSPRRSRQMSENLVSQVQPHYRAQFSPNKSYQESSRRGGWHEEGLGMSTPSPSHDPTLSYSTTSSTLADITSMPVGCGPTGLSSGDRHVGVLRDSQAMSVGSLGVQSVSHRYEQLSESSCSPSAEHDYPPFRSDVIDDSILDTSVSRPSEQRTKSGKI